MTATQLHSEKGLPEANPRLFAAKLIAEIPVPDTVITTALPMITTGDGDGW